MSKRDLKLYINDILESIEAIEDYVKDIDCFDNFSKDRKTYSATIREYIIKQFGILQNLNLRNQKIKLNLSKKIYKVADAIT